MSPWAPLDVLVLDMPPGTGDAQLTIAQRVPLKGAVIVSTPQDIALIDARKGIAMFNKTQVPILGVVENMSDVHLPRLRSMPMHIFGHGGARETAEKLGAPFLGEIPLVPRIRETSDAGTPVSVSAPDGPEAKAFLEVAEEGRGGAGRRPMQAGAEDCYRVDAALCARQRHVAVAQPVRRDMIFARGFVPAAAVECEPRIAVKILVHFGEFDASTPAARRAR